MEFAKLAASVCKVAKQGTVRKYVESLQRLQEGGDDATRYIAGYAMQAIATACLDRIQRYFAEIIPLAFMVGAQLCKVQCCVCEGCEPLSLC